MENSRSDSAIFSWIHKQFLVDRNNRFIGYIIFPLIALFATWMATYFDTDANTLALLIIVGLPLLLASLFSLKLGVMVVSVVSFLLLWVKRHVGELPVGIALDILTAILSLGLLIKLSRDKDWSWFKHPLSILLGVWILYSIVLFINPAAPNSLGWVYTIRTIALQGLLFFVALYAFDDFNFLKYFAGTIIVLSLLAALYGLYQELVGIPFFEMKWIYSDAVKYQLYFLNGRFRVFSFMSDPAIFGVIMATMSLFSFALAMGPWARKYKIFLLISSLIMFMAMLPSGTRTAYVLIPAGLLFLSFVSMNRWIILTTIIILGIGVSLIIVQPDNAVVSRVMSAFQPTTDASYQERLESQVFIQSYIQKHPIGSGLGTTGYWGQRFSPDTMLANFNPDSGYVRIAVEMGWIGLLILCALLFLGLFTGVKGYFRSLDREVRSYYLAFLVLLIAMVIASYAQLVFTQRPATELFFISLAAVVKLKTFEFSDFRESEEEADLMLE